MFLELEIWALAAVGSRLIHAANAAGLFQAIPGILAPTVDLVADGPGISTLHLQ